VQEKARLFEISLFFILRIKKTKGLKLAQLDDEVRAVLNFPSG
jgi:hypothetical protein